MTWALHHPEERVQNEKGLGRECQGSPAFKSKTEKARKIKAVCSHESSGKQMYREFNVFHKRQPNRHLNECSKMLAIINMEVTNSRQLYSYNIELARGQSGDAKEEPIVRAAQKAENGKKKRGLQETAVMRWELHTYRRSQGRKGRG